MSNPRMFDSKDAESVYKVEKNLDGCFAIYASHSYRSGIREKQEERNKGVEQKRNSGSSFFSSWDEPPVLTDEEMAELLDCFPIKLHISIGPNDIARVQLELIQLLLNAMADGIINEFKHTLPDEIMQQMKFYDEELHKIDLFKQYLSKDDDESVNIPSTEDKTINDWKDFKAQFGRRGYSDLEILEGADRSAKENKESIMRLANGSQFTVYLPMKYDVASVANLQNNVTKVLTDKKVEAGKVVPTQSSINNFVSLRLDKLDGYYVSALVSDDKTIDRLQKAQTSSELFQYLRSHEKDIPSPIKKREFDIKESANANEDPFRINRNTESGIEP